MSELMARPRVINPMGEVRKLSAVVPETVAQEPEREAAKRKVTVGQVMRERLAKA